MAITDPQQAATSSRDAWTILGDPRAQAAIAVLGLAMAFVGGLLLATSDHLVDPVAYGIQISITMLGAVGAAVVWIRRRPRNRIALYLLAYAFATAIIALQGASNELLHSLGVLVEPAFFLLGYVLVFAFPAGRPIGTPERLLLDRRWRSTSRSASSRGCSSRPSCGGGGPLAGCTEACPGNALMLADEPEIAAGFGTDLAWVVIALLTATIVLLAFRLAQASRPRRRTLLPVYAIALLFTVPALAFHGFAAGVLQMEVATLSDLGWILAAGRAALAYGSAARDPAGEPVRGQRVEAADRRARAATRARRACATRSPTPSTTRRSSSSSGSTAATGSSIPAVSRSPRRARATGARRASSTTHDGTLAAIWHDPALNTDPELVRAACQAVALALEHGRLETELAAAHARVVHAADAERRKVERDLHDGAQQRLLALQMQLARAQELAPTDSEIAARLAEVGYGLEDAVQELRDLARGVHPPVLRDFGLRAALVSATQRGTPPTALIVDGITRYPIDVETAVYFCCLESLQNVAKHAGEHAHAQVRVAAVRRRSLLRHRRRRGRVQRRRGARRRDRRAEHGRARRGGPGHADDRFHRRPGNARPRPDPGCAGGGSPRPNGVMRAIARPATLWRMPHSVAPAAVPRRSWAARFARRQRLQGSLWVVPLVGAIAGPLLAEVVLRFDDAVDMPAAWSYSESTASVILGAIVSALVALTGFVVAFGVLVVQMATQTLSPRFMRLWYRDGLQKALLGTFVATLTFSLALLRGVSDTSVPDAGVTIAGGAVTVCVVLFLVYLDRFVHSLRPVAVAWDVSAAGARVFLEEQPETTPPAVAVPDGPPVLEVRCASAGAIQAIDRAGLLATAIRYDCLLVLPHAVGDIVPHDTC